MEKTVLYFVAAALLFQGVVSTTFTIKNNCPYTIWPGLVSSSGKLSTTGFKLSTGSMLSVSAPFKWSGRIWARTGCTTDSSGNFLCSTGDCREHLQCSFSDKPPASLAEFTLNTVVDGKDFYDTSFVDGFNVPIGIQPIGTRNQNCKSTTCKVNINKICPPELQLKDGKGDVIACKSACVAFGGDQYCCSGEYQDPGKCKPTKYSEIFKAACPQTYSYAHDDETSTFTCVGADYIITFCP